MVMSRHEGVHGPNQPCWSRNHTENWKMASAATATATEKTACLTMPMPGTVAGQLAAGHYHPSAAGYG
jgi:hypothetical protein